jgi:hypothetical protein
MMSKEVMNVTVKSGKGEMDRHPYFRNEKELNDAIAKIRFKRTVRKLIKMINCK